MFVAWSKVSVFTTMKASLIDFNNDSPTFLKVYLTWFDAVKLFCLTTE